MFKNNPKNKNLNYQEICQAMLEVLTPRQREIIERRFGLKNSKRETLEQIGKDYDLSRERIRQVQKQALQRLEETATRYQRVFQYFQEQIEGWGGLKKEDRLLVNFGAQKFADQILFLLYLGQGFERNKEDKQFYSLWMTDKKSLLLAKKTIALLENFLEKEKKLFSLEELFEVTKKKVQIQNKEVFLSFLEVTKKIEQGLMTKTFGLSFWPEVNPRGIRDKAHLALEYHQKPLHFREITELINSFFFHGQAFLNKKAISQTVHNELIKDPRIILVGRGIYALGKWGFEKGTVKDIIFKVLIGKKRPLTKEEIIKEVSNQRLVERETIALNLANKKYFQKNLQGKYLPC